MSSIGDHDFLINSGSVSLLRATPCRAARRLALPNVLPESGGAMNDGKRGLIGSYPLLVLGSPIGFFSHTFNCHYISATMKRYETLELLHVPMPVGQR